MVKGWRNVPILTSLQLATNFKLRHYPHERPLADTERLRHALGLTPAEALLAGAMAEGRSLESCADQLGIAIGTARQRLKAIFAKTGTHRQGELVALLSRLLR